MTVALWLLALQGAIGAFDTLYYHEWRARLPARGRRAAPELKLHAGRDFLYGVLFCSLPFVAWQGVWVLALAAVLVAEIALTLWDFVVEIAVRKALGDVYAGERVTHAVMGILYGAMIAYLLPQLRAWWALPTGLVAAPLISMASIGTQISEAFAGLDRIRELMQTKTEDADDPAMAPLGPLRGEVEFEDVSFEYNPGVPVLSHVSFRAPAGTTTALVGSSGSGKSTLISLVMAFNRPLSGRVLIDGRDLSTIRLRDYRSQLGVVLQDNFLFDGTIGENLRYGRPGATLDQIREVSRVAHADEFIEEFEKKYDTVVGEQGATLSEGERQRLTIARAILRRAAILILDEPTSSVDVTTEAGIMDGLERFIEGRTTFVIAHRLSTVRKADRIIVMQQGSIVEQGTFAELQERGGVLARMYATQFGSEPMLREA